MASINPDGAIGFNLPEEMMAGLFWRLPVFPLAVDPATRELKR
jgi:hypothetical protein